MKRTPAPLRHARRFGLTVGFLVIVTLIGKPPVASAEQGVLDQIYQAPIALFEQANEVTHKSQQGYIEAVRDAPPEQRDAPFSRQDLESIRDKNARILKSNRDLADAQQDLANKAANALGQLPPNHPRYKEIQNRLIEVAAQMPDTKKSIQDYERKVQAAQAAVDSWKKREDPTYVPPARVDKPVLHPGQSISNSSTDPPAEPPPDQPPPNDSSDSGNALTNLKNKEAAQEAAVRALGQDRQSAVNRYLDDPSDENHANAQALRQQLDGMLDDLNAVRGQVDTLEGKSRPKLHARSATAIAKEHARNKENGTNTDGTDTQSRTGGCGALPGGSGMEQSAPAEDQSASHRYEEVGPGSGGGSGGAGSGGAASSVQTSSNHKGRHPASHTRTAAQMHQRTTGMNHSGKTNHQPTMKTGMTTANPNSSTLGHQHNAAGMGAHNQHQQMPPNDRRKRRSF